MTTVHVLLFGALRDAAGWAEREARGSTVDEVWLALCRDAPRLAEHRASIRPAIGCAYAQWADPLAEGATVAFIPPVAGGSTDDPPLVDAQLTREPIDHAELLSRARHPSSGAVDLFLGIVRDHNDGAVVTQLDYEAYEPMALQMMRDLTSRIAADRGVGALLVVHRLGALAVGDTAIAVVAAAPHRAEAFAASREVVDAIKADVPIFKREHAGDTVRWVDARCAALEVR